LIYLSGAVQPRLAQMGAGYLLQPNMGNRPDLSATPWAVDNGCFSQSGSFSLGRWIAWLEKMTPHLQTCLFANAPDVVADAEATWKRSRHILPLLRDLGYSAGLVAQDGLERMAVPWQEFDTLFIGGSTAWKLSPMAAQIAVEAKQRGKHVHMGRVNSLRRLRIANEMGCDSVDGTFLAFGPDINLRRLQHWFDDLKLRPSLWAV
jgi:hypothetical protein